MNPINRAIVKSQARELIKGKFFYLFIISFIVALLTGSSAVNLNFNFSNNNFGDFGNSQNDYSDYFDKDYYSDYFENFDFENGDDSFSNPIEGFENNSENGDVQVSPAAAVKSNSASILSPIVGGLGAVWGIAAIVFMPLTVTLCGIYLAFVRRNPSEEFSLGNELGGLFKNSFNGTYGKKLLLVLLKSLIIGAVAIPAIVCMILAIAVFAYSIYETDAVGPIFAGVFAVASILLFIPVAVMNYSLYFSEQIMSDCPNMKPSEALKLSRKMVIGSRTELFTLDLSFIPWYLLVAVTFGIGMVYVIPYVSTTQALYYENFRLRALAMGKITQDDFLSDEEKFAKYNASPFMGYQANNTYYNPNENASDNNQFNASYYNSGAGTPYNGVYFNPAENVQQNSAAENSSRQKDGYYYSPNQQQANNYQQSWQNSQYNQYSQPQQNAQPMYYNPPQSQPNNAENPVDNAASDASVEKKASDDAGMEE